MTEWLVSLGMRGFRDSDVDRKQCFKIELVGGYSVFVSGLFLMHRDAHICFVVAGMPWDFTFLILLGAHAPCLGPVLHHGAAFRVNAALVSQTAAITLRRPSHPAG